MKTGLCSVTFRALTAEKAAELAVKAGLDCIEWGGDVHVPPDKPENARKVAKLCRDLNLETPSYGSYYRLDGGDFDSVSKTAEILGARNIRVWAGTKDAELFSRDEYLILVENVKNIAQIARKRGQNVCFEYHYGTYCNSAENTLKLIEDAGENNVFTYWQPMYWLHGKTADEQSENLSSIKILGGLIKNVHVYNWCGHERLPLIDAIGEWKNYAACLSAENYFLEFVQGDLQDAFFKDASSLVALKRDLKR